MYAKIRINGDILVKTGMHIGGSSAFAAIGAVDSPIVRDVRSNLPLLPGSSLKGKMRSLLAKEFNESLQDPDNDHERIVRLFGSAKKGNVKRSRLLFSDMVLANEGELRRAGLWQVRTHTVCKSGFPERKRGNLCHGWKWLFQRCGRLRRKHYGSYPFR